MINALSIFPNGIDQRTFFQDVDIDHSVLMKRYDDLISAGKYTEASNFLNGQNGLFSYGADYFNMLENRIYATQNYILGKVKNNQFIYSDEEPTNIELNTIWV